MNAHGGVELLMGFYLRLHRLDPGPGGLLLATGTKLWTSHMQKHMEQETNTKKNAMSKQMYTKRSRLINA